MLWVLVPLHVPLHGAAPRCLWQRAVWSLGAGGAVGFYCKMSLAACFMELGCWGALEPGHWCRCRVRLQDVYGSACFGASVLAAAGCFCSLVAQKHILLSGFIWGRNAGLLEQIQGNMISFEFVSFFPPMLNASLVFLDFLDPRGCAGQGTDPLEIFLLCGGDGQPVFHYISP